MSGARDGDRIADYFDDDGFPFWLETVHDYPEWADDPLAYSCQYDSEGVI